MHDVGPSAGLFFELFAGRAVLSREMRGLNWRTVTLDDGSWPGAAVPSVRCDIREFRLSELSAVDWAGCVAAHFSLPCATWSAQAVDGHRPGRVLDGPRISDKARDANDVVRHVIGELRYLQTRLPRRDHHRREPGDGRAEELRAVEGGVPRAGPRGGRRDLL